MLGAELGNGLSNGRFRREAGEVDAILDPTAAVRAFRRESNEATQLVLGYEECAVEVGGRFPLERQQCFCFTCPDATPWPSEVVRISSPLFRVDVDHIEEPGTGTCRHDIWSHRGRENKDVVDLAGAQRLVHPAPQTRIVKVVECQRPTGAKLKQSLEALSGSVDLETAHLGAE